MQLPLVLFYNVNTLNLVSLSIYAASQAALVLLYLALATELALKGDYNINAVSTGVNSTIMF